MKNCATSLTSEMHPEELDLLCRAITQKPLAGKHLEIGTAAGGTLCRMMRAYDPAQRPQFVVVDPMTYFPDQQKIVEKNLTQNQIDPQTVEFRAQQSTTAFQTAAKLGDSFDFILVDGCHKILYVTSDMKWLRLLRVGGVACFHDCLPHIPDVWFPVMRFLKRHPNYHVIEHAKSLLAIRKMSPSASPEIDFSDFAQSWAMYPLLQIRRKWQRMMRARIQSKALRIES